MEDDAMSKLDQVIESNDAEILKYALKGLSSAFKAQRRNYIEAKDLISARSKIRNLEIQKCDSISIDPNDCLPHGDGILDQSSKLLAAIRKARQDYSEKTDAIKKGLQGHE